ncbi:hypothetical protein GY45DRAFT_1374165 [Cubamyces sp. BRFM 1775]|nr:hypothetical protein GY45DRAFT_1374165 [Cubamyces sp. BRFM 1775]
MPQSSSAETVTFEPPYHGRDAASLESLPVELITQIIRELEGDPLALAACASLKKSWRTFCLPYLYKRIEMKQPTERKLLAFLIFLEANPKLRRLIKSLLLNTAAGTDALLALHSIDLFTRIVACLPNLDCLAIRRIWFKQFEPPRGAGLFGTDDRMDRANPIPLRLLIVNSCLAGPDGTLGELPFLFNVFSLFKLKKLCLLGLLPPQPAIWDIRHRSRQRETLSVEHLEIWTPLSSEVGKVVAQELCLRIEADTIRSLSIVKANRAAVLAAGAIVVMVGQNLEAFMLDVSKVKYTDFDKEPNLAECLGLARCIKLRVLTFYVAVELSSRPSPGHRHCQLLARILGSPPPALRTIVVVLRVKRSSQASPSSATLSPSQLAERTDLPAVEKAVLDHSFPHLEAFNVRVELDGQNIDRKGWLEEVGRLLPRLKNSGLLTIGQ